MLAYILSCITFLLFCTIVFAISFYASKRRIISATAKMKLPLAEIDIYDTLLCIDKEFSDLKNNGVLDSYPLVRNYLEDISEFLNKTGRRIDINDMIVEASHNNENVETNRLIEEINSCPINVKMLVMKKNRILMRIVLLKYKGTAYILCNDSATPFETERVLIGLSFQLFISKIFAHLKEPKDETRIRQVEASKTFLQQEQRIAQGIA